MEYPFPTLQVPINNIASEMERLTWLEEKIAPTLEAMGFEVVRVAITGENGRRALQVMADRADGSLINIDDCTAISVTLNDAFEIEDPLEGAYNLEVSSAGIDRPLTRPKDFETYAGFEAKIQTRRPIEGRKKFKGLLEGLSPSDTVVLKIDGEQITLPLSEIERAQLVLTDALIAATAHSN